MTKDEFIKECRELWEGDFLWAGDSFGDIYELVVIKNFQNEITDRSAIEHLIKRGWTVVNQNGRKIKKSFFDEKILFIIPSRYAEEICHTTLEVALEKFLKDWSPKEPLRVEGMLRNINTVWGGPSQGQVYEVEVSSNEIKDVEKVGQLSKEAAEKIYEILREDFGK